MSITVPIAAVVLESDECSSAIPRILSVSNSVVIRCLPNVLIYKFNSKVFYKCFFQKHIAGLFLSLAVLFVFYFFF